MKLTLRKGLAAIAAAACCFTTAAQAVTVDLLVLYDSYSRSYFGNEIETAMKSWVEQMNTFNQNSLVDIQWRLVGVEQHEQAGADMGAVLGADRTNSWIASRREAVGADFVTHVHKTGACGIAYVAVSKSVSFSVVGPQCGPNAMAHELGHNLGLNHSRRQGDTSGTRYGYGLGYGVDNKFATIMAYQQVFNAPRVPKFSNPTLICAGLPCGVPEGRPDQAYAAKALNNVKDEIASFLPTRVGGGGGSGGTGVTVYQHYNHGGYSATLAPGSYRLADLVAKGVNNDDLSSAKIPSGLVMELYADDGFSGAKTVYTADHSGFPPGVNDTTSSIVIRGANIANGVYEMRARHSGQCMDLWQSGTADGQQIDQFPCNNTAAQYWQFTDTGSGRYELKSTTSNKCMDVSNISQANGAAIHQWSCLRGTNQLWYVLDNGDGSVRLQAVHSGKVADVRDVSTAAGALVHQWDWVGGQNQRWTLRRVN